MKKDSPCLVIRIRNIAFVRNSKCIPQRANQLGHMFNSSFLTSIVLSKLNVAKVIPLYKSENPENEL